MSTCRVKFHPDRDNCRQNNGQGCFYLVITTMYSSKHQTVLIYNIPVPQDYKSYQKWLCFRAWKFQYKEQGSFFLTHGFLLFLFFPPAGEGGSDEESGSEESGEEDETGEGGEKKKRKSKKSKYDSRTTPHQGQFPTG